LPAAAIQFIINASNPVNDKIFDLSAFEKFLHDRIKVDGRTGNLGDSVSISQQGDGKIEVIAHQEFSGRYLKYLYVSCPGWAAAEVRVADWRVEN
jgi:large subunit ribosomal protein L22e